MHARSLRYLLVLSALGLCSAVAHAQSFRCRNDLVNVGDSRASALLKCGEPAVKDSFCAPVPATTGTTPVTGTTTTVNVQVCDTVDEWTYNPGYGQFWTTLRFRDGKLESIKYGDRVK